MQSKTLKTRRMLPPAGSKRSAGAWLELDCESFSFSTSIGYVSILLPIQGRRNGLLQRLFIRSRFASGSLGSCCPPSQSALSSLSSLPVLLAQTSRCFFATFYNIQPQITLSAMQPMSNIECRMIFLPAGNLAHLHNVQCTYTGKPGIQLIWAFEISLA